MGNLVYDFADNSLNTKYVADNVIKALKEKYNRDFEVVKIGERYGMNFNDEATVLCTVKGNYEFVFKVIYNMVHEKITYDNFFIRCTCYYLEKEINRILGNVNSIVRVEIMKKNSLDRTYKIIEFLERFQDEFFVATLVIENKDINKIENLLTEIESFYKGIKLKIIAYEMSEEEYEIFYNDSKNLDYFALSYVENYKYVSRKVYSLENGNITLY